MAASPLHRKITYAVDPYSLAQNIIPQLASQIESGVAPLAQARGLTLQRERTAFKMKSGHPVPGLFDLKWKATKGMTPGFTVSLEHDKSNYLTVTVKARPWYPSAIVVALIVGSVLSYFYLPWLLSDFFRNLGNPILIVGMIIVFILSLVYVIRSLILSGIIAIGSTLTFGFIVGGALGWFIASSLSDTKHGMALKPGLMEIMGRLDAPYPLGATPVGGTYPAAYPAYTANPYAAIPVSPPAPVGPPRVHPPQPPPPPRPPAAPRFAAPGAPPPTAPCPTCSTPVAIGTPSCPKCGLHIVWD